MGVKIIVNNKVKLMSPYHPDLPKAAKAIGGKFDGTDKSWSFDIRDEERVRELARRVYGTDGSEIAELVTVQVTLHGSSHCDNGSIWKLGRELARRAYRDSDVRLGEGVIVVGGAFPRSGGSRKYPALFNKFDQSAVLEVRDIPRSLVTENEDVVIIKKVVAPESVTVTLTGEMLDVLGELRQRFDASTDEDIVSKALGQLLKEVTAHARSTTD